MEVQAVALRLVTDAGQEKHDRVQTERWNHHNPVHYRWQTESPYVSDTERALLEPARRSALEAARFLEIGCGEGANLYHLQGEGGRRYGVDRYFEKLAFARSQQPDLRGVVADAQQLPYADGSFDSVLVRDLLHHVYRRDLALGEAWRVVKPGGQLVVIEPNTYNPLLLAFALTVKSERGVLRSTPSRLRAEIEALPGIGEFTLSMAQPVPIHRIVLHPRMGRPSLGAHRPVAGLLRLFDRACRLWPRSTWSVIQAVVTKPAS